MQIALLLLGMLAPSSTLSVAMAAAPTGQVTYGNPAVTPNANIPPAGYSVYAYGTCYDGFGTRVYNLTRGITLQVMSGVQNGRSWNWFQNDHVYYNWDMSRYWQGLSVFSPQTWYRIITSSRTGPWVRVWIHWPAC